MGHALLTSYEAISVTSDQDAAKLASVTKKKKKRVSIKEAKHFIGLQML